MKKCMQCGALQDNKNMFCIDCNAKLGDPLTKEEELLMFNLSQENLQENIDVTDYLSVSKLDKMLFILLLIFAFLHYLLIRIKADYLRGNGLILVAFYSMLLSIWAAFDLRFPEFFWRCFKFKFRYSIENTEDMRPSKLWYYSRKIGSKVIFIAVIIAFIILLIASIRAGS